MLAPETNSEPPLVVGDRVYKNGGDYTYEGVIVAKFWKRNGTTVRYVVENDDGMLFIFNRGQLERG